MYYMHIILLIHTMTLLCILLTVLLNFQFYLIFSIYNYLRNAINDRTNSFNYVST